MFTTFHVDKLLNLLRATTYTAPANVYAGLISAVTDLEAGTVTEATFSGYARQSITFAAPAAGLGGRFVQNSGTITFPAKGDAGTFTAIAVGIWDASSAGNLLGVIYLDGGDPFIATVIAADVTNNTLTSSNHGMANDDRVRVEQMPGTGSIPTGLAENTTYWVVGSSGDTFQLSATQGGGAIDITAEGGVMVLQLTPVNINLNDQAQFTTNALKVYQD